MRRRTQTERKGAAIVEFAILVPFLLYLFVVAVDWARLMYFSQCVNDCARAGALWASDGELNMKSRYATCEEAARAESPGLSPAPTVSLVNSVDSASQTWATVTVSMPFNTITNFPGVPSSQTITRTVQMKIAPMATR